MNEKGTPSGYERDNKIKLGVQVIHNVIAFRKAIFHIYDK